MTAEQQEPWDIEKFIECYNEIAKERGGWYWDRNSGVTPLLKSWYEEMYWKTIRQFADARYMLDQEY